MPLSLSPRPKGPLESPTRRAQELLLQYQSNVRLSGEMLLPQLLADLREWADYNHQNFYEALDESYILYVTEIARKRLNHGKQLQT